MLACAAPSLSNLSVSIEWEAGFGDGARTIDLEAFPGDWICEHRREASLLRECQTSLLRGGAGVRAGGVTETPFFGASFSEDTGSTVHLLFRLPDGGTAAVMAGTTSGCVVDSGHPDPEGSAVCSAVELRVYESDHPALFTEPDEVGLAEIEASWSCDRWEAAERRHSCWGGVP